MGVYVHIPFCAKKCYYCDFHSIVVEDKEEFSSVTSKYLAALQKEILFYQSKIKNRSLSTLFIGGGTPSLLKAEDLAALITFLRQELPFVSQPEITIEANPHSLTEEAIGVLVRAGVNRVSLGAQAFQDSILKSLGRLHRTTQIEESINQLRTAGVTNLNLDLMYGLPGQGIEEWIETLECAIALSPTHFSCYSLILEKGTFFATWEARGLLDLPSDDLQAEMYQIARVYLKNAGYEQYEISNFCLPGQESQHNLLYWQNQPFLGLGSGATGYIDRLRYTNVLDVESYINNWHRGVPSLISSEQVSKNQEMDETMMVGMRLLQGVEEEDFQNRYGLSFWDVYPAQITKLIERGLVEYANKRLRVTEQGLYLENLVSGAFLR